MGGVGAERAGRTCTRGAAARRKQWGALVAHGSARVKMGSARSARPAKIFRFCVKMYDVAASEIPGSYDPPLQKFLVRTEFILFGQVVLSPERICASAHVLGRLLLGFYAGPLTF